MKTALAGATADKMHFSIPKSISILERTPGVLHKMLDGLSDSWTKTNEGENTWSPYDVVGHLIHGEKTDWIPRALIILSEAADKEFDAFDRFAHFEASKGMSMEQLLHEFSQLRKHNLRVLDNFMLDEITLKHTGTHPEFGDVTLQQLIATWVVHDLSHIAQIQRIMAKQYEDYVGPWKAFIPLLSR